MLGRLDLKILADSIELGTVGQRMVTAALLDEVGLRLADPADAQWCYGRADSLRKRSRSRRDRAATEMELH
ncbi:MAG TPA: hypothetical protein VGL61_06495 [Kofleriaceae bacterium]